MALTVMAVTRGFKNGDFQIFNGGRFRVFHSEDDARAEVRNQYEQLLAAYDLDDNGAADENGDRIPGGSCSGDEAVLYRSNPSAGGAVEEQAYVCVQEIPDAQLSPSSPITDDLQKCVSILKEKAYFLLLAKKTRWPSDSDFQRMGEEMLEEIYRTHGDTNIVASNTIHRWEDSCSTQS